MLFHLHSLIIYLLSFCYFYTKKPPLQSTTFKVEDGEILVVLLVNYLIVCIHQHCLLNTSN